MKGQAMVEYLLLTAIAVALLAVPFGDQPSVASLFLEAVRTAYVKFLAAMSLPQ
jgi:hypothetical protein